MKISTEQLEKIKALGGQVTPPGSVVDTAVIKLMDRELISNVVSDVKSMPDREEMIAEIKARLDAGTYQVTADEVVDAMVRRAKADQVS